MVQYETISAFGCSSLVFVHQLAVINKNATAALLSATIFLEKGMTAVLGSRPSWVKLIIIGPNLLKYVFLVRRRHDTLELEMRSA